MKSFTNWLESMGSLANFGQGTEAPASDEVKRTGLQPQVDAQDIRTKSKAEQDKISAVDGQLERIDDILASVNEEESPKLMKFKKMWKELLQNWEQIKYQEEMPNKQKSFMMQNQPLSTPQLPHGLGIGN